MQKVLNKDCIYLHSGRGLRIPPERGMPPRMMMGGFPGPRSGMFQRLVFVPLSNIYDYIHFIFAFISECYTRAHQEMRYPNVM